MTDQDYSFEKERDAEEGKAGRKKRKSVRRILSGSILRSVVTIIIICQLAALCSVTGGGHSF